jgi:hypothetical protein
MRYICPPAIVTSSRCFVISLVVHARTDCFVIVGYVCTAYSDLIYASHPYFALATTI